MRTITRSVFFLLLAASALAADKTAVAPAASNPARLPVKRVVLYKNGVGYFEHTGRVRGDQDLAIDFTTAQLNDVLKSLTVLDLGEGRVTGIRYDSIAPLNIRMKGLRLPVSQDATQAEFLNAIRGARVEVRSGIASAVGRLLSIEKRARTLPKSEQVQEFTELSLVSDAGELRTFELGPGTAVRVLEKDLGRDIDRYMNLLSSARSTDLRRMVVGTAGTGERDLFVSYISEVPIWKSTYRVLLRKDAAPLLQGWAIVDNTVGEDWNNVQLTLVAGAPQSFVQNISQPFYARRPEVALPQAVMLTPQAHQATMDRDALNVSTMNAAPPSPPPIGGPVGGAIGSGSGGGVGGGVYTFKSMVAPGVQGVVTDPSGAVVANAQVMLRNEITGQMQTTRTDSNGRYRFFNVQPGASSIQVQSPGFNTQNVRTNLADAMNRLDTSLNVGAAMESVEVTAAAMPMSSAMDKLEAEATVAEVGDLFEYDLKQRISIGKDQSALVPIINSRIGAEKVTLWNPASSRSLRALWITNSSGLTLDAGTFNVVEDGTFAGEGLIEPLKPAEKRLISYAADTGVRVTTSAVYDRRPATRVRIARGIMRITREQRETKTYTVHNADTAPREVVIEHQAREGWKLADGSKPEESTASFHRFRVKVAPSATEKLEVRESHPDIDQIMLSNLTPEQIVLFVQEKTIAPEVESSLRRILSKKGDIAQIDEQSRARQQEVDSISADQGRLRENMKALKGSTEEKALLQRYTHQLDSQEDRLSVLRKELAELKQKRESAGAELDRMIMQMAWDEKL